MTTSGNARELWLEPLVEARPSSDAKELARSARRLAASRA